MARTKGSVLLHDAAADKQFSADEYIRRHRARSILCVTLIKESRLVGVLYLETISRHIFHNSTTALLTLLASEVATLAGKHSSLWRSARPGSDDKAVARLGPHRDHHMACRWSDHRCQRSLSPHRGVRARGSRSWLPELVGIDASGIEAHRGQLSADANTPQAAVFPFTLPADADAGQSDCSAPADTLRFSALPCRIRPSGGSERPRVATVQRSRKASVPIPQFAPCCSKLRCELRNRRTLATL